MNWRRGLFRLWIVGSVLFVIAVAFVSYSDIKREFNAAGLSKFVLLPVLCGDARGVAGKDYTTKEGVVAPERPDTVRVLRELR
jgi:hypothetical protein